MKQIKGGFNQMKRKFVYIALLAMLTFVGCGKKEENIAGVNGQGGLVSATATPETTNAPGTTALPEPSSTASTAEPKTTSTPGTTAIPEATGEPKTTAAALPETTGTPKETVTPEITEESKETAKPETTSTPEETGTPETTRGTRSSRAGSNQSANSDARGDKGTRRRAR